MWVRSDTLALASQARSVGDTKAKTAKALFKEDCRCCHAFDVGDRRYGPLVKGVEA
jgi:cytochrome c2